MEILLTVFETGSITAAAERLFLTQPTISMQLKKMSEAVGLRLYDLVGKRVVFTEAGLQVVKSARILIQEFESLDMNLANLRGLKAGALKLAVVTTSKYFIPHLLGPFCRKYPEIDIQLKVGNRQQIIERLKNGSDDFYVFSHPPLDIETNKIEFLGNPLVAIAHENHPLSQKSKLVWSDIEKEPFLMRESGSGTRFAIEEFMRSENYSLNVRMIIESNEAIKHAVMSELGISILSAHTLTYGGQAGLKILNIDKLPIASHWYFLWLNTKQPTVIANEFLTHVQAEGRKMLLKELKKSGIKERLF